MTRRFLVTSALPYPNNRPHLGHIAGAYLPADSYVRYLRLLGEDVVFICGSDDHGVPVTITAQQEDRTPAEVVARYHDLQDTAFRGLAIEFDIFSGTSTCPFHAESSQRFFTRIHERGDIVPRDTEQFYCEHCARFLPDRYVEGTCPICKAEGARGDQCDSCTSAFEQTLLIDPYCATCRNRPVVRSTRHWFFRLDRYQESLREWIEGRSAWRESVRNAALGWVNKGLLERSITRDLTWGVPVPLAEAAGKVLYVWFDAPIGYLSFTQQLFAERGDPGGWRNYWEDTDTQLVHFIGKDNTIFHAVIWPAMLMGHGGLTLPANVPANEYLNFKGEKLSKSKGTAVWADEVLAEYHADRLRYYLTANAPEGRDTSFSFADFVARNNDVLSDVVGNLVHRVFTFTARHLAGRVPQGAPGSARAQEIGTAIARARDRWRDSLEACRLRDALTAVTDLARAGNRAFDAAEPWRTRKEDPERCALDLRACLELVHALGVLLVPFLPESAGRVSEAFEGAPPPGAEVVARLGEDLLASGSPITAPGILFPKLDPVG